MRNDGGWPPWLETLRPDELTRARMRRTILDRARPLLAARRGDWLDAVSDWATILSPLAAVITLVFAGLALRQAARPAAVAESPVAAPGVEDLVRPGEELPAAFQRDSAPDLDLVMTVIYEPAGTQ